MTQVNKPALLRRLFQLGCNYSGQILSYQKMLGQLHDVGNTTTLAHYLELLEGAGMLAGIHKYTSQSVRSRNSSPKLQVLNTALMSAQSGKSFKEALTDRAFWGRITESAIGAYLLNSIRGTQIEIYYWREKNKEVDFILKNEALSGMHAFSKLHPSARLLLVGSDGIAVDTFLKTPIDKWFY